MTLAVSLVVTQREAVEDNSVRMDDHDDQPMQTVKRVHKVALVIDRLNKVMGVIKGRIVTGPLRVATIIDRKALVVTGIRKGGVGIKIRIEIATRKIVTHRRKQAPQQMMRRRRLLLRRQRQLRLRSLPLARRHQSQHP